MFRAIQFEFAISLNHFRNADLLRNVSPLDEDYELSDVIDDAFAILIPEKKDVTKEEAQKYFECKDEAEFRNSIYKILIDSRKVALQSMRRGITLGGKCLVPSCARLVNFIPSNN